MDERVHGLARDIFSEVRRLGSAVADRTRQRSEMQQAVPAGGLAALGMVLAGVGGVLLLVTPVVPPRHRILRRRMLIASGVYVAVGGTAAAIGGLGARDIVRARARRTVRGLERDTELIRTEVQREMR